jgi:hypothetical protein
MSQDWEWVSGKTTAGNLSWREATPPMIACFRPALTLQIRKTIDGEYFWRFSDTSSPRGHDPHVSPL